MIRRIIRAAIRRFMPAITVVVYRYGAKQAAASKAHHEPRFKVGDEVVIRCGCSSRRQPCPIEGKTGVVERVFLYDPEYGQDYTLRGYPGTFEETLLEPAVQA